MAPVSIIIPTAGASNRKSSLFRAIRAVLNQERVRAVPIVVMNGSQYNRSVFDTLKDRSDIRFFHLEQPGLPGAINFGRCRVDTPFFGFLDDDDLYHPWAVAERMDALEATPSADVVVSWGIEEENNKRMPADEIWNQDDPLAALLNGCWLASCGGLFRTATISADYFDPELPHLEWTSVALRVALDRSLLFLKSEKPHFFIASSPESLSKSSSYMFGMEHALDQLLKLRLPTSVRRGLIRKKMANRHTIADHFRAEGNMGQAWRYHARTFYHREGLRFLPSTAHFVRSTIDRWLPY